MEKRAGHSPYRERFKSHGISDDHVLFCFIFQQQSIVHLKNCCNEQDYVYPLKESSLPLHYYRQN